MKNGLKELHVDFIGGQQQPVTKAEEFAISVFIRKQKEKKLLQAMRRTATKTSQETHQPTL